MKGVHLMLVDIYRHASTDYNEKDLMCGITDASISEMGRRNTMDYKEEGVYEPVDHCYITALKRTKETKDIMFPETEHSIVPELNEMDMGIYEGVLLTPYLQYENTLSKMLKNMDYDLQLEEGESMKMLLERAETGIRKIYDDVTENSYGKVAIVGHGMCLLTLFRKYLPDEDISKGKLLKGARGIEVEISLTDDNLSFRLIRNI